MEAVVEKDTTNEIVHILWWCSFTLCGKRSEKTTHVPKTQLEKVTCEVCLCRAETYKDTPGPNA